MSRSGRCSFAGRWARSCGRAEASTPSCAGLAEGLNQPQGLIYHARCSAVLGDGRCRFDLDQPGYSEERVVETVEDGRVFRFADFAGYEDRWFEKGRFRVLTGKAAGLVGSVKNDRYPDWNEP